MCLEAQSSGTSSYSIGAMHNAYTDVLAANDLRKAMEWVENDSRRGMWPSGWVVVGA